MGANTDQERTLAATHTFALTHGQVAMALRIGGGDAATETAADRPMAVRTHRAGACVSAAMVVAAAMSIAHATENHESRGFASSARRGGGSIPRASGAPDHENTSSTSQEQSKMLSKITSVTAAAAVGMAATVAGAQSAVQWKVSDGGNGHWYRTVVSGSITWNDAQVASALLGGHLATVTSAEEDTFAAGIASDPTAWNFASGFGPWLGGYQDVASQDFSEPAGGWRWVTGESWNWAAWNAPGYDEPNECTSCCGSAENFLHYKNRRLNAVDRIWNDLASQRAQNCGRPIAFIVEWDADCNNDGIVDYGQCHDGSLPDFNCNNIPDCCEHGEECVVGSYPVQWRTADGGNGHWYQGRIIDSAGVKWSRARDEAQGLGGDLVVLGSPQATAWVWEHVASQPSLWSAHFGPWVGARQPSGSMEPDGGWTWVDGTPVMEFVPWAPGQPDDYTPCGGANDFMSYFKNFQSSPQNLMCDNADVAVTNCPGGTMGPTMSAIVEWSRDCNHDGVVDYGQILGGELSDGNHNGIPDICEFLDCNRDGLSDLDQVAHGQLPDYDGNNIPDCCDHGEACVVGSYPVQWRTANGGNGHWYQSLYVGPDPTHSEAVAVASSRGAYLATMNAQEEQAFCVKILQHSRAAEVVGGAWFGLVQDRFSPVYSEPSGGWVWGDGPVLFTNWASGEPSNDCFGAAEDFANIRPDGRWNDLNERPNCVGTLPGGVVNSVLLEWSTDCNNDGTVDYGQILRGELPDINHNGTPDTCECIGDIYVDRAINGADLGALLAYWGPTTSAAASRACDLNSDGVVNGSDLGILLAYWGPCSN